MQLDSDVTGLPSSRPTTNNADDPERDNDFIILANGKKLPKKINGTKAESSNITQMKFEYNPATQKYDMSGIGPNGQPVQVKSLNTISVLVMQEHYEDAKALADVDVADSLNSPEAWNWKSLAYERAGDDKIALKSLDKAIELAPATQEYAYLHSNRAMILNHSGRYQEAADEVDLCLKQDPTRVDSLLIKADALMKMGKTAEALECCKTMVEGTQKFDPVHQEASLRNMAQLIGADQFKNTDDALTYIKQQQEKLSAPAQAFPQAAPGVQP